MIPRKARTPIALAIVSAFLAIAPGAGAAVGPVVTATAPSGISTDNTPQVGYTALNASTVICAVDPVIPIVPGVFAGFAPCPASPYSLPALADGNHDFFVVAQDINGNYGYALKSFTIDATGPVVTIAGISEGQLLKTAWPPLSVSAADPGTGVMSTVCAYDAMAATSCSNENFLNAPLRDGAHVLNVASVDGANNVTARTVRFSVDAGGFILGFDAPTTAKFIVRRGKLKSSKYSTTFSVSFALPAGASPAACSGSAKINVFVKKKQIGSTKAKFTPVSARCVVSGTTKLAKKYKSRKLRIGLAYASGPITEFKLYGSGKL